QDQAAVGRDRHDRDAVVLGLGSVGVVLHHLQVEKAREQQHERREHGESRKADAQLDKIQLALVVLELAEPHIARVSSTVAGMRCGSSSSRLTNGQSAAPKRGPTAMLQPGNSAPAARRTSAEMPCAKRSSAATCSAWPQSENQRMRRESVLVANASSE